MSDVVITVKSGQTGLINFTVYDENNAIVDLTNYTVTMAIRGANVKKNIVGTKNSPNTLGTGYFTLLKADYVELRPNTYEFEIWVSNGDGANDSNLPTRSGKLKVVDVPQRIA